MHLCGLLTNVCLTTILTQGDFICRVTNYGGSVTKKFTIDVIGNSFCACYNCKWYFSSFVTVLLESVNSPSLFFYFVIERKYWGSTIVIIISACIVCGILGTAIYYVVRMKKLASTTATAPFASRPEHLGDTASNNVNAIATDTDVCNATYDNGGMRSQLVEVWKTLLNIIFILRCVVPNRPFRQFLSSVL